MSSNTRSHCLRPFQVFNKSRVKPTPPSCGLPPSSILHLSLSTRTDPILRPRPRIAATSPSARKHTSHTSTCRPSTRPWRPRQRRQPRQPRQHPRPSRTERQPRSRISPHSRVPWDFRPSAAAAAPGTTIATWSPRKGARVRAGFSAALRSAGAEGIASYIARSNQEHVAIKTKPRYLPKGRNDDGQPGSNYITPPA